MYYVEVKCRLLPPLPPTQQICSGSGGDGSIGRQNILHSHAGNKTETYSHSRSRLTFPSFLLRRRPRPGYTTLYTRCGYTMPGSGPGMKTGWMVVEASGVGSYV